MINVFQPTVGDEELAAVKAVFDSGWIGRGSRAAAFETAFAAHLGADAEHVVAVNSCTEGLFLAMEQLNVGVGTDVVLPSISFVGAANAIAARGARPVFCDVDPATLNPTVSDIAAALTPRTGAVVVLHYGGAPGDIREIAELCRERGIPLVEDAACAVASTVDGRPCGTFGDIGVWSFDSMKILVTGDGAMIHCEDPATAAHMRQLSCLGMDRANGLGQAATGDRWWDFEVLSVSRRSIINDITAAIGMVQLDRLPAFIERRGAVAKRYDEALSEVPGLRCPPPLPPGHSSSHLFYWIQLDPRIRDAVARRLYERGIYTTFRYLPLHHKAIYRADVSLPGADAAASRTLCIPMHQGLDDDDVDRVIREVTGAVQAESG